MTTDSYLFEVASATRSRFERHEIPRDLLAELYADYNPAVQDPEQFIDLAYDMFPRSNCGLASCYLGYLLRQGKIINGAYLGEQHTFLTVRNGIIDITADQFGGPKVYVGPMTEPWTI